MPAIVLLLCAIAFVHPAHAAASADSEFGEQQFLGEYAIGIQRLPMDGGKIYGWKIHDKVTFGRFKGENDGFGFSVELKGRQRIEITTDGLRWRKAIGGSH